MASLHCAASNLLAGEICQPSEMISTRFTDSYGITHPIAQAGMAFVGMTPDLALAVCAAGGLGSIGVGLMPPPALKATIDAIRAGTSQPFNINFITSLSSLAQIEVAANAGAPVASFHWGHPPRAWIEPAAQRGHEGLGAGRIARRGQAGGRRRQSTW